MVILLIIVLVLAAACLFVIWPGSCPAERKTPFQNRNFAHRGLFAEDQSVPENSLPAFAAAAQAGYGCELDVQFTKDKKLVVFHDDTADRMTGAHGWVRDFTWEEFRALRLKGTAQRAPLFEEMLATVAGRIPLIVEIKSRQEYSGTYLDELCAATVAALRGYQKQYGGAYCIESFDPRVVARIRRLAPDVLRGQLADTAGSYHGDGACWLHGFVMSRCLGNVIGRPQFIAWCPAPQNLFVRLICALGAMRVMWTALPTHDAAALQKQYDAVIFQWYRPAAQWQREPRA